MRRFSLLLALGFLAMSCDDPVPPSPEGALKYRLTKQASGPTCRISVPSDGIGAVNGTASTTVVNDKDGAAVTCRVAKSGGDFAFSGSLKLGANNLSASGTITPGQDSVLRVTVYSDAAKGSFVADPPNYCTVNVTASEAEPQLHVKEGEIWAKFSCPSMTNSGAPTDEPKCAIIGESDTLPGGYFVFKNCDE